MPNKPNKPTKRPPTKTSKQVHKKFHMSLNMLAGLIVLGIVLVFVGFNIKNYLVEQQTLRELDTVGKDLRVIYDKILEANKGNVEESYFRNECNQSSAKLGEGQISCGSTGRITITKEIALIDAEKMLDDSSRNSSYYYQPTNVLTWTSKPSLQIDYKIPVLGISGYGSYSPNQQTQKWSFTIGCRKTVPDFLPGYTVK